jgi:hypothetical protein
MYHERAFDSRNTVYIFIYLYRRERERDLFGDESRRKQNNLL